MNNRSGPFWAVPLVMLCAMAPTTASAALVEIETGQTSVLLDTDLLSAAAGLDLSSVSPDVITPGSLGAGSVAFGINSRSATAPLLPTTFAYDSDDFLGTFSGTIEHVGSVFFNADSVEVGNFTIGFDATRASTATSGFFVESTTGVTAVLFDIAPPTLLDAGPSMLTIGADLLVSPEFAAFLGDTALTGADVGDALVEGEGSVPLPATLVLIGLGLIGLRCHRRATN